MSYTFKTYKYYYSYYYYTFILKFYVILQKQYLTVFNKNNNPY